MADTEAMLHNSDYDSDYENEKFINSIEKKTKHKKAIDHLSPVTDVRTLDIRLEDMEEIYSHYDIVNRDNFITSNESENKIILDFIEQCVETKGSFARYVKNCGQSKDFVAYKSGDLLKDFKIAELDYKSEYYLTEASIKSLKNILGDPVEFNKLTRQEKSKKQIELDRLSQDEYIWKATIKKTVYDPTLCSNLYPEGYLVFKDLINEFFYPNLDIEAKASKKFLPFKAQVLVQGLTGELVKSGYTVFKPAADLSDDELHNLFHENVDIEWVFNDLCRIILKKAHDNTFNNIMRNKSKFQAVVTNDILAANVNAVERDFRIVFAMYLLNIVLNHLSLKKGNKFDYQSLGKIVSRYLKKETNLVVGTTEWWKSHSDGVKSIIFAIGECGIFQFKTYTHKESRSNSYKKIQKFIVPLHLMNHNVAYMRLPRIFKSDPIDVDKFNDIIKPIFKGDVKISCSPKFRSTLNISKDKKYKINPTYLMLLSSLFNLNKDSMYRDVFRKVPLPFPFRDELDEMSSNYYNSKVNAGPDSMKRYIAEQIQLNVVGKGIRQALTWRQCLSLAGSSVLETKIDSLTKKYKDSLYGLIQARKMSATILRLAECYKDFPIFITDFLCSRGRCYPEQPLISRTSGRFKHLLQEYNERKITLAGFVALLQAYYKPCPDHQRAFSEFLSSTSLSKKNGMKLLADFFHAHPLDFTKIFNKQFPYFMLLHAEILKVIKTGRTGVMIEIDHVASGVTLLSYLIRNKEMARACNVLGGPDSDPYHYCRSKFKDFYETQMNEKSEIVSEFLCNDRKIHKYASMCYTYAQVYQGRSDDFVSRFEDAFNRSVSFEERKVLNEFAKKYDHFIHFVFPKTKKQIDLLLATIDIAVKELGYFPFKNLQGETFEWSFYDYKTTTRSAYNPLSHKATLAKTHKTYNFYEVKFESFTNSVGEIENRLKRDHRTCKRKALSYMIHCIDASLIHRFIYRMHELHKYSINHLHDCVLVHPNYVDAMYDVIEETYKSDELYFMANHLFFDHIANHVSEHTKSIIEKYKREFESNCDDFADELKNVNVRNVYKYEG